MNFTEYFSFFSNSLEKNLNFTNKNLFNNSFFNKPYIILEKNYIDIISPVFQTSFIIIILFFVLFTLNLNLNNSILFNKFYIAEKELNNVDDLVFALIIFFWIYTSNVFGFFGFNINSVSYIYLLFMLVVILLLIPLTLLYNFGLYFSISIKGSGSTLSFIYELILDYINLISYFLRILIQLIRLVIIGVTFYFYNHLILSYSFFYTSSVEVSNLSLFDITLFYIRLVFEIAHSIIIFFAQSMAFLVMVLWLFQFLFTLFFEENMENIVFKKKTKI